MLLKTGIIGIGNAGNMVAAEANSSKEMPVIGLNTSERDLDAVKSRTAIQTYFIGNGDGAGKDRTKSKAAMKDHLKELIGDDEFKKFMDSIEVCFIVSSTGGGTGSGTAPMICDVLSSIYQNINFIMVGILPTLGESVGAQRNTVEYIAEVNRLNLPYMLFDNSEAGTESTNDVFDRINHDVVEAVSVIRGDYNLLSRYGMIDAGDMTKLITLPGMIHMNLLQGIYQEKIPTDGSIEDLIIESLKKNTMVQLDRDKIVKRRGYIVNLTEDLQPYFNKDFPKITELYGEPVEVFDHYAVNQDDEKANFVILIQSGLSLPENRLKKIQHRIQAAEEALKKQKESSILDSLSESVSQFDGTKDANRAKRESVNLDDILGKY